MSREEERENSDMRDTIKKGGVLGAGKRRRWGEVGVSLEGRGKLRGERGEWRQREAVSSVEKRKRRARTHGVAERDWKGSVERGVDAEWTCHDSQRATKALPQRSE
jgi:hypothetical protein